MTNTHTHTWRREWLVVEGGGDGAGHVGDGDIVPNPGVKVGLARAASIALNGKRPGRRIQQHSRELGGEA